MRSLPPPTNSFLFLSLSLSDFSAVGASSKGFSCLLHRLALHYHRRRHRPVRWGVQCPTQAQRSPPPLATTSAAVNATCLVLRLVGCCKAPARSRAPHSPLSSLPRSLAALCGELRHLLPLHGVYGNQELCSSATESSCDFPFTAAVVVLVVCTSFLSRLTSFHRLFLCECPLRARACRVPHPTTTTTTTHTHIAPTFPPARVNIFCVGHSS